MKNIVRVSVRHGRNVLLCSLLAFGLAACGAGGSSSSGATAAVSDPVPSLVTPDVGLVDRSGTTAGTTTQSSAPLASAAPPSATGSVAATPPSTGSTAATASTPPVQSNTGVATLDWLPPTENSDGSVLTNLAGYTVYYGTSPNNLTQSVKVTNPGLTAYTLSNLPSGTWYFAVTAYSSAGAESTASGVVSTTI